ncbi:MAG: hypothetical protein EHM45_13705 [Desulfobacteraceae bacterium]|nr:MAG: hypothetical protein EHM45_13705 [Desulfobacteraceae bacterium]
MKKILATAFYFTLIFFTTLITDYASAQDAGAGSSKSNGSLFPKWTWISGDNVRDQAGVYGTQGVPSATNKPGGRRDSVAWIDAAGDLWLFGGWGRDAQGNLGFLNDLWRYRPADKTWTWVSGEHTVYQRGVYDTKGVPSATGKPGGRQCSVAWIDAAGDLWLFGGSGLSTAGQGRLNDLWRFRPTDKTWIWVSGDDIRSPTGVYGTQGVPSLTNKPGGRSDSVEWDILYNSCQAKK